MWFKTILLDVSQSKSQLKSKSKSISESNDDDDDETPTPTNNPTKIPTQTPTKIPTQTQTKIPTQTPTKIPTQTPTKIPTQTPTIPTQTPTSSPSNNPTCPTHPSTQSNIIFSEDFIGGASSPHCSIWNTFRSALTADLKYSSVTVSGTYDICGITMSEPAKVLQLANALRTSSTVTVVDGSNTWRAGADCETVELTVNQALCECITTGYSIYPCDFTPFWGGVNTDICGSISQ
eukprot:262147_1